MQFDAIVYGKVQKVGFRYLTKIKATSLGLCGTVKNLPDGTVELHVIGPKETIEELLTYLKFQFTLTDSSFKSSYSHSEQDMDGFQIIR